MFIAIIAGIIVGFVIAMPPGPIGITAIKLSLNNGLKQAIHLSAGAALMDFFYCMITFFATASIFGAFDNFTFDYPELSFAFQVIVIAGIIIFGIFQLRMKEEEKVPDKLTPLSGRAKFIYFLTQKGPFFLGIALGIANVANPTFLPSLAIVTSYVYNLNIFEDTRVHNIIFATGFGVGNFLWLYLISRILVKFKDKFSGKILTLIHRFAGITLIVFGIIMVYRIIIPKIIDFLQTTLAY